MSKRLQILTDDREAAEFERAAKREGLTLSEWARKAMRIHRDRGTRKTVEQKLRALDRALECGHPTADIDEMLREIEAGRALR